MTCTAVLWHGPGHQSQSRCHVEGDHDVHEAEYVGEAGFMITARWRNGSYTDQLRAKGIAFSPRATPTTWP